MSTAHRLVKQVYLIDERLDGVFLAERRRISFQPKNHLHTDTHTRTHAHTKDECILMSVFDSALFAKGIIYDASAFSRRIT